jgi:hypothetical protein
VLIDDPLIGAFENGIAAAKAITTDICEWENRWSFENLVEQYPGKFICSAKWTRPSRLFRNL